LESVNLVKDFLADPNPQIRSSALIALMKMNPSVVELEHALPRELWGVYSEHIIEEKFQENALPLIDKVASTTLSFLERARARKLADGIRSTKEESGKE
jgi:hypothetical protein